MAASVIRPLVLMALSHGAPDTYGVAIGDGVKFLDGPHLKTNGGWILQPKLNASALTAAGENQRSFSWTSCFGERFHGIYLCDSVLREAFIKMEDESASQLHPGPSAQELKWSVKELRPYSLCGTCTYSYIKNKG